MVNTADDDNGISAREKKIQKTVNSSRFIIPTSN